MRQTIYRVMGLVVIGSLLLPTPAVPVLAGAVHTPTFRSADSETRSFGGATEARASRSENPVHEIGLFSLPARRTVLVNELNRPNQPGEQLPIAYAHVRAIPNAQRAPPDRGNWRQIAVCETHANWSRQEPIYSGGLGISNDNWKKYGLSWGANAGQASVDQQIAVANTIAANGGATYYADPGCGNWKGW